MSNPIRAWFPFEPADFYGSLRVRRMTLEAEAVYLRLLSWQWQEGSIPVDYGDLGLIVGKGFSTALLDEVLACFEPDPDDPSRLRNVRMEEDRAAQEERIRQCSAAGKRSADARKRAASKPPGGAQSNARSTPVQRPSNEPGNDRSTMEMEMEMERRGNGETTATREDAAGGRAVGPLLLLWKKHLSEIGLSGAALAEVSGWVEKQGQDPERVVGSLLARVEGRDNPAGALRKAVQAGYAADWVVSTYPASEHARTLERATERARQAQLERLAEPVYESQPFGWKAPGGQAEVEA